MTYNLTNITAANETLEMFQAINKDLTQGLLGNGWSIVFFIVIFMIGLSLVYDMRKALLASATISFILGIFFYFANLINVWLIILYLVLIVISVILLQDKDTGS